MKGYKEFVAEANPVITTITGAEAAAQVGTGDAIFINLRGDVELAHTGIIPGAVHLPRGMLEFVYRPDKSLFQSRFWERQNVHLLLC